MPNISIVDGPTILAGESLSDAADCSAGCIVRITVPQEFTKANLTFQVSTDGVYFNDVFDTHGKEILMAAEPNSAIIVQDRWTKSVNFIKFRSGSRAYPVEQQVDCRFAIAIEDDETAPAE